MPIMLRSCCCVLYGKDEAQLAELGECPLDPGGYFVIKGTEKVMLIQEQLSKNRIIIDSDKKGNINASVTSSTEERKSKTVILMEKGQMYLHLNQFVNKIPIMIVMKAMGMESDQEVVQMVGRDPRYSDLLLPSIRECAKHGVYTKQQALEHLEAKRCVYIASDGGRVCRPLVIADKGISRIKEHHMKELLDGVRTFDDFLRDGLMEYLDVNEENNALIALYEGKSTPATTHIEIEPFTILGICAGLIPFPHHNQSPRNTYQCAMGKQAMGNIAYNQVGYDKLGAGQNATVAVMSYSGYDIEDAIVMNKSSLDRGFGRCIVLKRY
ncbi:DNA-directed RNA polymerase III subunit RPC2 [Morella rubra]|uniref:DNA-directed RNA polymerase n=1 Tax=Morella rubra TaxID=262757 RepID=A0A6A1ULK9_9ROSI|nr:DNA-directed RNA polymerase III subunit RPC2 [Morella rubra]